MSDEKEKKIIIDEGWKEEARKEKEKLVEEEKTKESQEAGSSHERNLPEASFAGLVSMLATQTLFALGAIRSEQDKDEEIEPDLQMAKFNIGMLEVIEEKSKGNLTDEEAKMLKDALHQLRMLFVSVSK